MLRKAPSIKIWPAEGYCEGRLFKAFLDTMRCAIVTPEVTGYPKTLLEVIAPLSLREMFHLKDGDTITVIVNL
jgi:CTP-dependent riboflavin kinase